MNLFGSVFLGWIVRRMVTEKIVSCGYGMDILRVWDRVPYVRPSVQNIKRHISGAE